MQRQENAKKTGGGRAKAGVLLVIVVLLLVIFGLFWNQFTKIRVIEVSGVQQSDANAIVERSGLTEEMHPRDIDPEQLESALGTLGKWEYLGYEQIGHNAVRINMRTRYERAVVHYAGSSLVLDEYGQVMENRRDDPEYSLLEITGLEIGSVMIGRELQTTDRNQILSVSAVIRALDETGLYSRIRELNASDLDNLFMITVSGVHVDIGDATDMVEKCDWTRAVLDSLAQEGKHGGRIDVSAGISAVYSPQ
ncbi:MAG: cell division protein FtsQ/DivIB [Eubacteriales bacterium]|nr:cell division protein FtsQ/DivIB [Eubacteriales bacterium]